MASEMERLHVDAKQRAEEIVSEAAAVTAKEAQAAELADKDKQRLIAEVPSPLWALGARGDALRLVF